MTILSDWIAEGLAELSTLERFPLPPLGYGVDLACTTDLDPAMAEVDPMSQRAVSEAIMRRLDCPRGALPDDPDYGLDLRGMLNTGTAAADITALAGRIRSEVQKDDRVDSVVVTVAPSPSGSVLAITLAITPIDPLIGGFRLVLSASSASVLLEEINSL